eukprot:1137936-Pelagomonas_calceolata.AAC.1
MPRFQKTPGAAGTLHEYGGSTMELGIFRPKNTKEANRGRQEPLRLQAQLALQVCVIRVRQTNVRSPSAGMRPQTEDECQEHGVKNRIKEKATNAQLPWQGFNSKSTARGKFECYEWQGVCKVPALEKYSKQLGKFL